MSDLRYCVTGFIDSTGVVVERAKYDGYGKRTLTDPSYSVITTPVVDQSYGYTGRNHDTESALQYYRARYFDNDMGRFLNRDPIGYVDGLNLYRAYFVPLLNDPTGLVGGGRRQEEDCHDRFQAEIDSVQDVLKRISDMNCPVPGIYCECCKDKGQAG